MLHYVWNIYSNMRQRTEIMSRTSPCFGNDVSARTFSHTSQGCGTLQSNESRSWYSTVKRVKVVGLYSQTSQGRGIDVTTSPDFPALETTPGQNVNGMPLSTLLSLPLQILSDNISYPSKEEEWRVRKRSPAPLVYTHKL